MKATFSKTALQFKLTDLHVLIDKDNLICRRYTKIINKFQFIVYVIENMLDEILRSRKVVCYQFFLVCCILQRGRVSRLMEFQNGIQIIILSLFYGVLRKIFAIERDDYKTFNKIIILEFTTFSYKLWNLNLDTIYQISI